MIEQAELTLRLARIDVAAFRRLKLIRQFSVAPGSTRELRATCFDTPDRQLRALGLELQISRECSKHTQVLRTLAPSSGRAAACGEWKTPISGAHPDLAALMRLPGRRQRWVSAMASPDLAGRLAPVFSTRIRSIAWLLRLADASLVRVSLDSGELRAGNACRPVAEVHLALESGDAHSLFAFALALQEKVDLRVETQGRSAYGYALRNMAPPAAAIAQKIELRPDLSIRAAARCVIQNCVAHIQANEAGVVESDDPECVHQMRVGLRRLRSALRLFSKWIALPAETGKELRWLGQTLGGTRDAEVLATNTLPALASKARATRRWSRLQTATASASQIQRSGSSAAVASARYSRLMLHLVCDLHLAESGFPPADPADHGLKIKTLRQHAARLTRRLHDRLIGFGKKLADARAPKRHRARIAAKQLRYATEFFQSLDASSDTNRYLKRLAELQDALGDLNDGVVADGLLRRLAKAPRTGAPLVHLCRAARKCIRRDERKNLMHLRLCWKRFLQTRPPAEINPGPH